MAARIARWSWIGSKLETLGERLTAVVGPASHYRTLLASALHIFLIWTLAALMIWQNYNQSVDGWKSSAQGISLAVAAHAAQAQHAAGLVLSSVADWVDDEGIENEAQFRQIMGERRFYEALRSRVVGLPQIGMASIAAGNGDVLNSISQWPPPKLNVADREAFVAAMQPGPPRLTLGGPAKGLNGGPWRFFMSRKLVGRSGETLGMIAVGFDVDFFAAFFRRLTAGPDSWVSLFRSDGTLLATSLADERLLGRRYPDSLAYRLIQEGRSGEALLARGPAPGRPENGSLRITAATAVEGFPAYVAVAIGESVYLAPWLNRTYFVLGIALVLTVLTLLAALRILWLVDRSDTARRVEAQRQVLAAIVETPSALTAVVAPSGKVLHYNNRFRELLGRDGRVTDALFNPDLKGAPRLLAFAAGSDRGPIELDLEIRRADGQTRRLHFSLSRQSLPDIGDCLVLIGHDETQRHQAQQAITMSARLVTLGEMTTSIAHEVSQPLNVIRMAAQNALVESTPRAPAATDAESLPPMSDAEFRRFATAKFHRIVSQVDRAAGILSRMRIFSRKPGEDSHVFEVPTACRDALGLLLPQLRRDGIRVMQAFSAEPLFARGSQALMEQVLVYLLRNARDALLAVPPAERTVTISAERAGSDRVVIRVADNGPGVPVDIRERIFEPFFTTKPGDKHTGLGLALAFGAVRDSGGSLSLLASARGAIFQIDLPAHSPP